MREPSRLTATGLLPTPCGVAVVKCVSRRGCEGAGARRPHTATAAIAAIASVAAIHRRDDLAGAPTLGAAVSRGDSDTDARVNATRASPISRRRVFTS